MRLCPSTIGLHVAVLAALVMGAAGIHARGSKPQPAQEPLNWGEAQEGFRMGIHGDGNQTLSVEKALLLVVTMENVSGTPLEIVETGSLKDYVIHLQDEKGDDVPLTQYGKMLSDSRREILLRRMKTVPPGESLVHTFHINRIFDMTLTGTYSVKATRTVPRRNGDGFVDVESNRIAVTVTNTDG